MDVDASGVLGNHHCGRRSYCAVSPAERRVEQERIRNILGAVLLFLTLVLAVLSVINTTLAAHRSKQIQKDIRFSQYSACIKSGNVLRAQVKDEFIDIKRSVLIPVFSEIAQTLPPKSESKKILHDSVIYMRDRIATINTRIPDADCDSLYPPLDNQSFPDVTADTTTEASP